MDSFIIIGKEVGSIFENLSLDFDNKKYVMIGKQLHDNGVDFIHLNCEIFNWINDRKFNVDFENGTVIEIIKSGEDFPCDYIKIPNNIQDACAWIINANRYSSKTIQDLEKNYI